LAKQEKVTRRRAETRIQTARRWKRLPYQQLHEEAKMTPETVVFFLGEKFRWALMGEDEGEENDEDSLINDLELFLSNYEADWDGRGYSTPLEHWGWEHLRKVLWVKRNSGLVRETVVAERAAKDIEAAVFMPVDTTEETALWVVKTLMRPARVISGSGGN
jgi:hypothetical protein